MAFDIGRVLTQSWGITWKHKSLWILLGLPALDLTYLRLAGLGPPLVPQPDPPVDGIN